MFPDFSALIAKITMFEEFLLAAANSLQLLHTKTDTLQADVNAIKATKGDVGSIGNSLTAITDVLVQGATILGAVQALHGTVVTALPVAEIKPTVVSDQA